MGCTRWSAVLVAVGVALGGASGAGADEGSVDRAFGRGGSVLGRDLTGGEPDRLPSLRAGPVVLPDGSLLVVVMLPDRTDQWVTTSAVLRLRADGTPDPAFGDGGAVELRFDEAGGATTVLHPADVAVGSDGRIALAGSASTGAAHWETAVALLEPDGSLTAGFGVRKVEPMGSGAPGLAFAVQLDGRDRVVVRAVRTSDSTNVLRFLSTGSLDPSFDGDGVMTAGRLWDLVHDDGGFVALTDDSERRVLVRFTDDGAPDPTFGGVGRVVIEGSQRWSGRARLWAGSEQRLVVVHETASGVGVLRFGPDGRPDERFGAGGAAVVPSGPTPVRISASDVADDGSVLVGGDAGAEPIVLRVRPDGTLDTAFGCGGRAHVDSPGRPMRVAGVHPTADGGALVVGGILAGQHGELPTHELAVVRLQGPSTSPAGYRLVTASGEVTAFGDASPCPPALPDVRSVPPRAPTAGIAPGASPDGYLLAQRDGEVSATGDARLASAVGGDRSTSPVVDVVADPDGAGYWLAHADGTVRAFEAPLLGSMAGGDLVAPVVGMAVTRTGRGYLLVGADGGVFAFGDASFAGSLADTALQGPVVGIATSAEGYWLAAADGGVFGFGRATFAGSLGDLALRAPIADIAADPDGTGYWLAAADGGVFAFDAPFLGSLGARPPEAAVVGITAT